MPGQLRDQRLRHPVGHVVLGGSPERLDRGSTTSDWMFGPVVRPRCSRSRRPKTFRPDEQRHRRDQGDRERQPPVACQTYRHVTTSCAPSQIAWSAARTSPGVRSAVPAPSRRQRSDDCPQSDRHPGRKRLRRLLQDRGAQRKTGLALERPCAGHHLVEHDAQSQTSLRASAGSRAAARSHVGQRSRDDPGPVTDSCDRCELVDVVAGEALGQPKSRIFARSSV